MATTTNYGWTTPNDTDLVRDGASAIRSLGSAIDTTVFNNANAAVQKTLVDAKGDLVTATAADTPARLAVGNNGETLVADSSTSTGLRWTAAPSRGNPIINSAFQVWQRGTSFSVSGFTAYTADRWIFASGQNSGRTVSRQLTNDTTNLPNIQYCVRVQRNSGNSATSGEYIGQCFESVNSIPYAGKTITFSFYARAGANYSATSNVLNVLFETGTGTDQNGFTGTYTGANPIINTSVTLTTTWQRFSATATLPTNATEMEFYVYGNTTGTAGANDYYEITGVQIDLGSVALPFRTYSATLAGELAACQRYYQRISNTGGNTLYAHSGINLSSTRSFHYVALPVNFRGTPSIAESGAVVGDAVGSNYDVTAISIYAIAGNSVNVDCTHNTGYAASNPVWLALPTNAYIEMSAEL